MAAKPKAVDWEAVGIEYRAGILTTSAIGKSHGISHTAVQKRAKAEGWTRDLSKRIAAAREAKVSMAMVSTKVAKQQIATEKQVVEANAGVQADIILSHRKDIEVLRTTVRGMAAELGAVGNQELQDALELVLAKRTEGASKAYETALNKAFDAALALGGRSTAARNLAGSLATLIDKERQAVGIDRDNRGQKSYPEWLEEQT